ncbi:uncharacterized protein LOC106070374 isoform X1 [Biomphalaria glabrata]|uniref:Uncharacterized protein LOC106070374 isoform X1 n=1 Tax=Biomphalaria glabrata TaxID=6526 RepID=A0A9W3AU74_BIOGL|nr:uncharacterized protein LOC106070374 isoform X1 [Biomphalaria glabrata]
MHRPHRDQAKMNATGQMPAMNETDSAPTELLPTSTTSPPLFDQGGEESNPRYWNGILVLVFMLANVVGNGLVISVYFFSIKKNLFSFYVVVLAVLNLVTAFTTMLFDVIVKTTVLDAEDIVMVSMCKFSHFQVYTNHMLCGFILTLIAHQRYKKVCQPHEASIKINKAACLLLCAGALFAFICLPSLVVHSTQRIQLKYGDQVVRVVICRIAKKYDHSAIQAVLSSLLTIAFVVVLLVTVTYYVHITRALRNIDLPFGERVATPVKSDSSPQRKEDLPEQPPGPVQEWKVPASESSYSISQHTFRIFVVVTIVFTISYVPHLAVLALLNIYHMDTEVMTSMKRFFLELAYNSPYISTVSNPVIYGFAREEFRQQCLQLITLQKYRARRSYF